MWILTSFVANFSIAFLEWNHRTSGLTLVSLSRVIPAIAVCQAALWFSWRNAPSVMVAWATLTLGNTVLRIISTHFILHEPLSVKIWAGIVLISAGTFVMNWR